MEEKAVFMNPGLILLVFDMGKMRVDLNVDNWINWIFWDILGVFVYLILGQTFWDCLRDCLRLRIWFFRMFTLTPLIPIVGWGMVITGTRWNWGHGNRSRRIYWHWAPWLGQHFWNWQANIGIFNILQYSSNILQIFFKYLRLFWTCKWCKWCEWCELWDVRVRWWCNIKPTRYGPWQRLCERIRPEQHPTMPLPGLKFLCPVLWLGIPWMVLAKIHWPGHPSQINGTFQEVNLCLSLL